MEAFDMAHKLEMAGKYSAIPFKASPVYITSQVGAPEISSCRVFIPLQFWTTEGVMDVAREIVSTIGPMEQFDIGLTPDEIDPDLASASRSGEPGRLTKIDPQSPLVVLRMGNQAWRGTYPRLDFQSIGFDEWRQHVDRGIASNPEEQVESLSHRP